MEIERLHEMLTDAGIEHEWRDRTPPGYDRMLRENPRLFDERNWGWQVIVYKENGDRLVSAVEGWGTYGYGNATHGIDGSDETDGDLIEIMGLLTPDEEECDIVVGYLTAEEVFRRITEALGRND